MLRLYTFSIFDIWLCLSSFFPVQALLIQTLMNLIVGIFVFKTIIEPQGESDKANQGTGRNPRGSSTSSLCAYGIAIPCLLAGPIYIIKFLDIKSVGLIMVFLASPIVSPLKVTEGKKSKQCINVADIAEPQSQSQWKKMKILHIRIIRSIWIYWKRSHIKYSKLFNLFLLSLRNIFWSKDKSAQTNITKLSLTSIKNYWSRFCTILYPYIRFEGI